MCDPAAECRHLPIRHHGRLRAAAAALLAWCSAAAASAPFSGMVLEDAPALGPADLLPAYADLLGQPMSDRLVVDVSGRLTRLYRDGGYFDPAPRVVRRLDAAGVLVLEVREPALADVRVNGREHVQDPDFWLLVRELQALRPLGPGAFDDWLARANSLGVPVQGRLARSSSAPHQYVASLTVTERRWHGLAYIDNRGPEALGREIAQLSVGYRAVRPWVGQLRVDAAVAVDPDELTYVGAAGEHRITTGGTLLRWRAAHSTSTLPVAGTERSVDHDRRRAVLDVAVPMARQTRVFADLNLALHGYDLAQDLDDGQALRRDRIRAAAVSFDGAYAPDSRQRHRLTASVTQGLDGLGAKTWTRNDFDPVDGDFLVGRMDYRYQRQLDARWRAAADLHLQASGDRLPTSERFFIGGGRLGGAFDPATLSGDDGVGARLTIERTVAIDGVPFALTAFGYLDHSYVRSNGARPSDDAGSVALGARGVRRGLSVTLEVALPVVSPQTPSLIDDDARLLFSVSQRF